MIKNGSTAAIFNPLRTSMKTEKKLEKFLKKQIPLLKAMKLEVKEYSGLKLALKAPLKPNKNDKNTGFAGSIYTLSVITGWSLLFLKLKEAGLITDIVIHTMSGTYISPVEADFYAEVSLPDKLLWENFLQKVMTGRKAKIPLEIRLISGMEEKFTLNAHYAAWKKKL